MTLSVTCKLLELSLHEYVTTVEFQKILSQYLAFTSKKLLIWESYKKSPNYQFDLVQALMILTLSVSFVCHMHVEHAHRKVFCASFHVWIMC